VAAGGAYQKTTSGFCARFYFGKRRWLLAGCEREPLAVLGRWMRTRYRIGFRVGYRHSFRWIQHFRNECRFFYTLLHSWSCFRGSDDNKQANIGNRIAVAVAVIIILQIQNISIKLNFYFKCTQLMWYCTQGALHYLIPREEDFLT
jgi:hypothetical protein